MKKIIITITLICATGSYLSAQSVHEFSGYVGGGLSTLRYQLSSGDRSGGFGGDFGVGYTYLMIRDGAVETGTVTQQSWGIHVGLGLGLYNAKAKLDNAKEEIVTANLRDPDGDRFNLFTTLSGYEETQTAMFLNIPVMAQFNINSIYVMGGIKTGIPLNGKYKSNVVNLSNKAQYTGLGNVTATAPEFVGFGEFKDQKYDGDIDLGVNVALALEAGMNWSIGDNLLLYGGIYFDYGLNNISKDEKLKFIDYSAGTSSKPESSFIANSVLSSYANDRTSIAFTDKVNTMAVGIKLRLAFRR